MPREFALSGILFPSLIVVFVIAAAVTWIIDGLMARANLHRYVWHPPLFRLALFACLFGAGGLLLY
ncbi:DUF1656 domain-containing protein [Solimonas marina]|uniref:DUF1656 domain-containing protein n=1 Tax=Solimonas marina TaxID=2714601 RepID=A0A969WBA7_9GAMM|nr:DUF1656 domain-containing protein [Solimonas marina]NKF22863.1 DUF1656 domain-containing protein [Solimonas marina]